MSKNNLLFALPLPATILTKPAASASGQKLKEFDMAPRPRELPLREAPQDSAVPASRQPLAAIVQQRLVGLTTPRPVTKNKTATRRGDRGGAVVEAAQGDGSACGGRRRVGRLLREQATLVKRLGEVQVAMEAAMKATKRGSSAGAGRARHQAARRKRDATSGKFICHVDGGGGCGLTPPKTNMTNGEPHDRVTAASAANNDDDDSNEEENRDDAQVKEGGEAKTHDGSSKLTGTNPERRKPIKQRWQEETDPGAEVYENPLLRVDEDDEYDYDEDDNGVMAVARTPHRRLREATFVESCSG